VWLFGRDLGCVVDHVVAERAGVRGVRRDLAQRILSIRLADDAEKSARMDDARVEAANVRAVLAVPAEDAPQQSYSCRVGAEIRADEELKRSRAVAPVATRGSARGIAERPA
jgi:hypothetical protein